MKIVVCVKQVPDTAAERNLRPADPTLDRASGGRAHQRARRVRHRGGPAARRGAARGGQDAEVTILTMGPEKAAESIRKALSMGADQAVHLLDDGLAGSDALSTSYALAQAIKQIGFDLVICGSESTDARMGVMAAMLAERLGVPQASLASKVEVDGSALRIRRVADTATEVEATLPAVISVVEQINEPRYPSFKGIMAAKKKPVETMTLADPGIDAGPGRAGRRRPPRWSTSRSGRHAQAGHDRQGRRRRRRQGRRVPRRAEVHLRAGEETDMAEILVLVEHAGRRRQEGHARADHAGPPVRRAGPWCGPGRGAEQGQARCAEYGAARIYVAADPASTTSSSRPRPSCSPSWSRRHVPGAGPGRRHGPRARKSPAGWRSRSTPA